VLIHGTIEEMDAMYINIGRTITDLKEDYKCTVVTETVRNWGVTYYGIDVPLYDGNNTVFVKSPINTTISLTYNSSVNAQRVLIDELFKNVDKYHNMHGIKIANNERFVAHRGASGDTPENTNLAFVTAVLNGFKVIEGDVRFTSDNVPVMLHDPTIDRTSDGTGAIAEMTHEQVGQYDFGSWKHKSFKGIKAPIFENFINICWKFGVTPYVDIGGITSTITDEQISILFNVVKKYGMESKVVWCVGSFTPIAKLLPHYADREGLNFAFITSTATDIEQVITDLDWYKNKSSYNLKDVYISMNHSSVTKEREALCNEKNIKITVYTVNDIGTAKQLAPYKIDSIATDKIDIAMALCMYYADIEYIL
jgi:glycerophosphoryl diester phosphodiesterase